MTELGQDAVREEHHGIPVLWAEAPEPFVGALVFRVGRADETLSTSGITHLVEHLALFPLGRPRFPVNGLVELLRTAFFASGTVDEVVGALNSIAKALREVPLERLEDEKRVLLTEEASAPGGSWETLMSLRYGAAAHGLPGFLELGLRRLGPDEVENWARARFTRGNAAIWLTGPVPEGLDIELPEGERSLPPEPQELPQLETPAHAARGSGGVSLSVVGKRSVELTTGLAIAGDRAHRALRLEQSLSYSIGGSYDPLTADVAHVTLGADCLDTQAPSVQAGLLAVFDELAATGPTEDELEEYLAEWRRALADPLRVGGYLDRSATDDLFGAPARTNAQLLHEFEEVEADRVARTFENLQRSRIVLAPEGVDAPPGHRDYGGWTHEPIEGRRYSDKHPWPPRRTEVVVSDEAVAFSPPGDQDVTVIANADCVAALRWGRDRWTLVSRDGSWIETDTRGMRRGQELAGELQSRFGELEVPMEGADVADTVEQVADEKLKRRWVVGGELELLPGELEPGETLVTLAEGSRGLKAGLIAVTDRRVLFLYSGMTERGRIFREFPLAAIESIEGSPGVFGLRSARVELVHSGERLKFTDVHPRERAAEIVHEVHSRRE